MIMRGPGPGHSPGGYGGPRVERGFDGGGRHINRAGPLPGPAIRGRDHNLAVDGRRWDGHRHDGARWDGRYWRRGGVILGTGYYGYPWWNDTHYDEDYGEEVVSTADDDDVARCRERYRSFDPATGTFLGYDGKRRICPYLR